MPQLRGNEPILGLNSFDKTLTWYHIYTTWRKLEKLENKENQSFSEQNLCKIHGHTLSLSKGVTTSKKSECNHILEELDPRH